VAKPVALVVATAPKLIEVKDVPFDTDTEHKAETLQVGATDS
jgi:hypothetical protein